MIEDPADAARLFLAGTYGIVSTTDRGAHWFHICEASFSLQDAYLGDPLLDWTADHNLLVGVQASINISRDNGCQWDPVLAGPSMFVIDDAFSKSQPGTIFALVATSNGTGPVVYSLERSLDSGASWSPAGGPLPVDIGYAIDIDPGDPAHLYVTGLSGNEGVLAVSSDSGSTWTSLPIPNTDESRAPFLAAVDPLDPNRIFVRTNAWLSSGTDLVASDSLLFSPDRGQSWTELFHAQAKLLGFALSPDGSTVLVGYGDPRESASEIAEGPFGVYKSTTGAFSFEPIFAGPVACLAWTKSGVYVCGSQPADGFELSFSPDADFSLDSGCLTTLMRLDEVRGPLACGAATTGSLCGAAWDVACATFGSCQDAGAHDPRCVGASADAGSGSEDAGSTAADAGVRRAAVPSSCSCRSVDRRPRGEGIYFVVLMLGPMRRLYRYRSQRGGR